MTAAATGGLALCHVPLLCWPASAGLSFLTVDIVGDITDFQRCVVFARAATPL